MRHLLCCVLLLATVNAPAATQSRLDSYVDALAATMGDRERTVLVKIPELDRRLLALRAYVRAGPSLSTRWSWTRQEIEHYAASAEYRGLLQELDRVQHAFEQANPGYTLYANREVRSLDTQIERWNSNPGVKKTAASLHEFVASKLADAPDRPDAAALKSFKELLSNWRPTPVAPLAAPGLSLHGRMRAIDFQIMRNGQIVAATEVRYVARDWQATGWTRKLQQAVAAAGGRFAGPLTSPNEPWHYEYKGESSAK